MRHIFILNPAAGKGNKLGLFEKKLRETAEAKALSYEIYHTDGVGDATHFVRERCESTSDTLRFYACGGDGTVNEVVSGVVGSENAEVAIVPIGTGNDFVRVLGKYEDFLDIEALLEAEAVPFDVLKWNGKYCVNMMNIGFDGEVAARASRAKHYVPSGLAYICGVVGEFFKMSSVKFRCVMDGEDLGEKQAQLSLYANGSFCGGGFRSAPYADLHDGLMDVCFIRPVSRLTLIRLIGEYKKGTHMLHKDAAKYFEYYKCSEVKLTFDKPQRVCIDGEIEECETLDLSVHRDAVRIVMPKGAASPYERIAESELVRMPV